MRVIITVHAKKRLHDNRQKGIMVYDIVRAASIIPGHVPVATRFRGFVTDTGRDFDLVVKDIREGRLVITVIGK